MASVWYTGTSDARSITAGEWFAAGIAEGGTTTWNKANGWSIASSLFSPNQLLILGLDSGFNLNGTDGPRPGATGPVEVGPITTPTGMFNVRDYGAKGDNATDDTAAIAAAVTAAGSTTGVYGGTRTVWFPPGVYLTGTITLPHRVGIEGCGMSTRIKLKNNAGQFANLIMNVQNYSGVNDGQCNVIKNVRLDGNKGQQVANSWNSGLVLINNTPSGEYEFTDGRHQVDNVFIANFTGTGFTQSGRGGSQVSNVAVWDVNGFGFNLGIDSEYVNCDAGGIGLDGFLIQGNNLLTNCKAWFCGSKLVSSRTTSTVLTVNAPTGNYWDGGSITPTQVFSLANGFGNGFLFYNIAGTSPAGNFNGGTATGLVSQDNARAGFYVRGGRQTLVGIEADSNSNTGTSDGTGTGTPTGGSFAGVELDGGCSTNTIIGVSWDRQAAVSRQKYALKLAAGAIRNRIQLSFMGTLSSGAALPPMSTDSVIGGNMVQLGMMGGGYLAPAYAATWTPDPFSAETHKMTLTGNITIADPKMGGSAGVTTGDGLYLIPGMRLILVIAQDATGGRTVTLGSAYRLNGKSISTTASAVTAITFIWDGTSWQA